MFLGQVGHVSGVQFPITLLFYLNECIGVGKYTTRNTGTYTCHKSHFILNECGYFEMGRDRGFKER